MSHEVLVLACLVSISFVAGGAKGLTGFGGALVMAPLFSLLIRAQEAAILIVLVHCVTSLQGARTWSRQVSWRFVAPFGGFAVLCTLAMGHWLARADTVLMRHLVAVCVLGVTVLHMRGWRWRHGGQWPSALLAGAMSGAMTALGGLGGPAAVFYFNGVAQGKVLRANLLGYFALLFSGVTVVLIASRLVPWSMVGTVALLTPFFALGVICGERGGHRLSPLWYDRIVCVLLMGSGLVALVA